MAIPDPASAAEPAAFSTATLQALELPSLLALIAELAASDVGAAAVRALRPATDGEDLARRRQRYAEAERLLADGALVPSFETPLAPLLERLEGPSARPLGGREVVDLATLLEATERARGRVAAAEPAPEALLELVAELPNGEEWAARVRRRLDRRGVVRDDATPELARLRGAIRRQRQELYEALQGEVARHREHLSEETVPMRDGRLVLVLAAGARGRLAGLTHGRSATGKSFYFEPLSVVEGNNRLQQAWEEEEAERQRVLAELVEEARRLLPTLRLHAGLLAALDLLQAAQRFAVQAGARLAELADDGHLRLVGARHPLLDPLLADLRQAALGHRGHQAEIVPVALELTPENRVLVITGPNAGGKTVTLKTAGLLALAAQSGLPVPAGRGTALPDLAAVVGTVGDEQDLLADRSTFSGRLLRLREAWENAGPRALLLLDELGSGTDPEEGAALAGALVEGLLAKGALAVVTTHLVRVAGEAMESSGAGCATMQLDPDTGEPLFRLLPGPPGGSEALALARRLGLPGDLVGRAQQRLGAEGRDYRRLLAEVARLRTQLASELEAVAGERRAAAAERERAERARASLEAEARTAAARARRELEAFRREVRGRLDAEVERLREELEAGRRRGLAREATERLLAEAPIPEAPAAEPAGELAEGARVRHRQLGWEGTLERLDRGRAEVASSGKRLRCRADELVALEAPPAPAARRRPTVETPASATVPLELHLVGQRVEAALDRLDQHLDAALLAGLDETRIVHGHGTGRLRDAIRQHLRRHAAVGAWRAGGESEGGNGATVVTLKG